MRQVPSKDKDAWSAFLNDPNEGSIDDSQQQDGSRQESVDLLNWSTNDDSDDDESDDGDDSDGAVVALNTSTMSNIMAPRVSHMKASLCLSLVSWCLLTRFVVL